MYFFFFLQECIDKLKEGDKVKVLDPLDGDVVGIGWIHSLSIVHGVNLKGIGDANVNILKVTSNIPLVYVLGFWSHQNLFSHNKKHTPCL